MFNYKVLYSIIIVIAAIYLSTYDNKFTKFINYYLRNTLQSSTDKQIFTASELSQYNGLEKPDLYLAILGVIYNVSKGADHYGPGKTYNIFVGRDATRCFVTGKFDLEHVSDDITGLSNEDIHSLNHWVQFYKKEYKRVGKLIGLYYDDNGKPTHYHKETQKLFKAREIEKHNQHIENVKFPPCNIEWNAELGRTRVWCTKRSGGIERNWIGVPRQLYEPGSDSYRCACISDQNQNIGNIKEYHGCDPSFDTCYVHV